MAGECEVRITHSSLYKLKIQCRIVEHTNILKEDKKRGATIISFQLVVNLKISSLIVGQLFFGAYS